jgi:hypothetical protein
MGKLYLIAIPTDTAAPSPQARLEVSLVQGISQLRDRSFASLLQRVNRVSPKLRPTASAAPKSRFPFAGIAAVTADFSERHAGRFRGPLEAKPINRPPSHS